MAACRPRMAVLTFTVVLVALGGCFTVRFGFPPHIDRLAKLRPGVSSMAEVLAVLGEPRGRGAARFSAAGPPQAVWFYEYGTVSPFHHYQGSLWRPGVSGGPATFTALDSTTSTILLVLFEADRYAGHLWFAFPGQAEAAVSAGPGIEEGGGTNLAWFRGQP